MEFNRLPPGEPVDHPGDVGVLRSKILRLSTMSKTVLQSWVPVMLIALGLTGMAKPAQAQRQTIYSPMPIESGTELTDVLSDSDIPTGFGGFARDYTITFESGDHIVIDLISDDFDTIITLISPDGSTFGENDDGPDGTTNSLLFARIVQSGTYVLRVRPYAGQGSGSFQLKVTRLRPVD